MISDGQGYNHVKAANLYQGAAAAYQAFPVQFGVTTYPLNTATAPTGGHVVQGSYNASQYWSSFTYPKSGYTDSAAAATALSTGVKTYNNAINWDNSPATTGTRLTSIFEIAKAQGKAIGTVSTVEWTHATPASFGGHNIDRDNYAALANEMLGAASKLDVILGAGNPDYTNDGAAYTGTVTESRAQYVGGLATWNGLKTAYNNHSTFNGFTPVFTKAEFENLANGVGPLPGKLVGTAQVNTTLQQARSGDVQTVNPGTFNAGVPSASTLAKAALNVLSQDPDGFFVMMETGGAVDWAAHSNQKGRLIEEQMAFNNSVQAVLDWLDAKGLRDDTLLIVTADHETGHLWGATGAYTELSGTGTGVLANMYFNSGSHTNALVPLYATGPGAELFASLVDGADPVRGAYIDNTDVFTVMAAAVPEPAVVALWLMAAATLVVFPRRCPAP